ncbi:unnamed protein product [Lampetra fluviatilis]
MDTGELGRDDGRAFKQQQQQGGRGGAVRPRCAAGLGSSTRAALTDSGSWLLLLEDAESNRSRGPPGLADGKGKRRGARPMHASTLSLGGSSLGEEFRTSHRHYHVLRRAGIKNWQHNTTGVDMWTVTTPQRWAPPYRTTYTVMHSHGDTPVRMTSAGLPLPRHQHNILTGEVVSGKPTRQTQRVSGNIILQQQRLHTRQEPSGNQS